MVLARTFQRARRFSPLAGLKRSETGSSGADVAVNLRQSLPEMPPPAFFDVFRLPLWPV
jgi:hypothetical protein